MTEPLTFGHLFAGIDGFGLGLHQAGHQTAWTCELADFPNRILQQRLPDAEHYRDVRELTNPPQVQGLAGGFPCQDLSNAGRRAGISGARSGLWGQYARIIGETEPEVILIENVPALLHRGFEIVARDLVTLGYHIEWDCIPAAAFGAPHLRDRVWIVAHQLPDPCIFGQPAALFPVPPIDATAIVGGDGDDDDPATSGQAWQRWPRAGWIDTDPALVMPLQPLAPLTAVKAGRLLLTTPQASDGIGGRVANEHRGHRPSGAKRGATLANDVRHGRADLLLTPVVDGLDQPGALNPDWVEWLMGFPLGWTDPDTPTDALTLHPWTLGEPPGIPRVIANLPHRRERLTALGNALVPPAAEWLAHRYNTARNRHHAHA